MAEIALAASILQVADIGVRLGLRLSTFGEAVAKADRSILAISKDITLTSSVLQALSKVFQKDKQHIRSNNAVQTAETVVNECYAVFKEMEDMLLKEFPQLKTGVADKGFNAKAVLERFRWPTIRPKIELLNCNLDRMKSTLTLMLQVIKYARKVSAPKYRPMQRAPWVDFH